MIEATVTLAPEFSVTSRRTVYEGQIAPSVTHANFDISRDGKEPLLLKTTVDNSRVIVVHDWKYELRSRMSATRE